MTDEPRRRASDRERWTDDRLDELVRALGRDGRDWAMQAGELDHLKDVLERSERDTKERFDRAFLKLDRITDHVAATNGRVTDLERVNIAEEAARAAAARAVDNRRQELAMRVAQHGWIRPTLAGAACGVVATYLPKLFS